MPKAKVVVDTVDKIKDAVDKIKDAWDALNEFSKPLLLSLGNNTAPEVLLGSVKDIAKIPAGKAEVAMVEDDDFPAIKIRLTKVFQGVEFKFYATDEEYQEYIEQSGRKSA